MVGASQKLIQTYSFVPVNYYIWLQLSQILKVLEKRFFHPQPQCILSTIKTHLKYIAIMCEVT